MLMVLVRYLCQFLTHKFRSIIFAAPSIHSQCLCHLFIIQIDRLLSKASSLSDMHGLNDKNEQKHECKQSALVIPSSQFHFEHEEWDK